MSRSSSMKNDRVVYSIGRVTDSSIESEHPFCSLHPCANLECAVNIANLSVTRTNSIDRDESWRIADGKTRDRDDKLSAFGYFIRSIRSQYATVDLLSKNIICLTSLNRLFECLRCTKLRLSNLVSTSI